jgi:hypothetical protein
MSTLGMYHRESQRLWIFFSTFSSTIPPFFLSLRNCSCILGNASFDRSVVTWDRIYIYSVVDFIDSSCNNTYSKLTSLPSLSTMRETPQMNTIIFTNVLTTNKDVHRQ